MFKPGGLSFVSPIKLVARLLSYQCICVAEARRLESGSTVTLSKVWSPSRNQWVCTYISEIINPNITNTGGIPTQSPFRVRLFWLPMLWCRQTVVPAALWLPFLTRLHLTLSPPLLGTRVCYWWDHPNPSCVTAATERHTLLLMSIICWILREWTSLMDAQRKR